MGRAGFGGSKTSWHLFGFGDVAADVDPRRRTAGRRLRYDLKYRETAAHDAMRIPDLKWRNL